MKASQCVLLLSSAMEYKWANNCRTFHPFPHPSISAELSIDKFLLALHTNLYRWYWIYLLHTFILCRPCLSVTICTAAASSTDSNRSILSAVLPSRQLGYAFSSFSLLHSSLLHSIPRHRHCSWKWIDGFSSSGPICRKTISFSIFQYYKMLLGADGNEPASHLNQKS